MLASVVLCAMASRSFTKTSAVGPFRGTSNAMDGRMFQALVVDYSAPEISADAPAVPEAT